MHNLIDLQKSFEICEKNFLKRYYESLKDKKINKSSIKSTLLGRVYGLEALNSG